MRPALANTGAEPLALLVLSALLTGARAADPGFVLPSKFLGLWQGQPEVSVLGPWQNNMTFGISQDPVSGDYMMQDGLVWDGQASIGWQRFYVSATSGLLGYCGWLQNYTGGLELAGAHRLDMFQAQDPDTFLDVDRTQVTYCINSSSDAGATLQSVVLPPDCVDCECANWTFSLTDDDHLNFFLQMAGAENHTHSKHIKVQLVRVGDAPAVNLTMPDFDNFACDFDTRDNQPVVFPDGEPGLLPNGHPPLSAGSSGGGCPYLRKRPTGIDAVAPPLPASGVSEYEYCYEINAEVGYRLEWTLSDDQEQLHVAMSFPTEDESAYVSLGFRPAARNDNLGPYLKAQGFGKQNNFGMRSADIVVGHLNGVDNYYANLYTGPPDADDALTITNSSAVLEDGRLTVRFSRPVRNTGKLHEIMPFLDGSILEIGADIIWATGTMADDNTPNYHSNARGLRFIGWADPDANGLKAWKCT